MLVILAGDHLLSSTQVCQSCLLADQSGQPRWHQGRLCCGRAIRKQNEQSPDEYECQMGFRVAKIE